MTNHYFSKTPDTAHHFEYWSFELRGKQFHFKTDSGVFSKGTVDFGSRVLIDAFEWAHLPEGPILDVGCGYGPIGLALAHASQRDVEMVDVNERAVALAEENARHNGIEGVTVHTSNLYTDVFNKNYAAIVSNPPIRAGKKVVHKILAEAAELLKQGGTLTVVIQKKQGAPSAHKKMEEIFGNVEIIAKEKGYYVLRSEKQ